MGDVSSALPTASVARVDSVLLGCAQEPRKHSATLFAAWTKGASSAIASRTKAGAAVSDIRMAGTPVAKKRGFRRSRSTGRSAPRIGHVWSVQLSTTGLAARIATLWDQILMPLIVV